MATDRAGRPRRQPVPGRKARSRAVRSSRRPPGRTRHSKRPTSRRRRSPRASFRGGHGAARRRSVGSTAASSTAAGDQAARSLARRTRLRPPAEDRTAVVSTAPEHFPAAVRWARDSPAQRSPAPDVQAADLLPNNHPRAHSAQGPSSQRLSFRDLRLRDLSFPGSSFPGSFRGRRHRGRMDQARRGHGPRHQDHSTAARTPAASPALLTVPWRAVSAARARPGFTGREPRAACRPATRASSKVSFRPAPRCSRDRSRRADQFRPG